LKLNFKLNKKRSLFINDIGTTTTATSNVNITDLGTPDPTQHGFCWNITGTPNYIQITGDHASDFSVDAQPSSNTIAANTSFLFTVTFDPSALGTRTAEIQNRIQ
jgi:hypothetical protein